MHSENDVGFIGRLRILVALFNLGILVVTTGCGSGTPSATDDDGGSPDAGVSWSIETVIPSGTVGMHPSIAVDADNHPHISYCDYAEKTVKYAYWDGTDWSIQTVGSATDPSTEALANGGLSSIALDGAGNPHICYYQSGTGGGYIYARQSESGWTHDAVPLGSYVAGGECSIAVDETTGAASISLLLMGQFGMALGYWNSSSPGSSAVVVDDSDGNSGYNNSIVLGSDGFARISYEARGDSTVNYAIWNGSSFEIETVSDVSLVYWETRLTSLAVDDDDNPHVAYYGDGFRYAHRSGSQWEAEAIPYNSGYPALSLSLDGTSRPHMAFVGIDTGNCCRLKHASWDGSAWSFESIDDDVDDCGIAVDGVGRVHIVYSQGNTDTVIKYALK